MPRIIWPVQTTHLSLWCRWYTTLLLAMPCPLPGLAACGKIPTFISTTGPAATDTRSTSNPCAQVPASTICPTVPSPQRTRKHTHTQAHTYAHIKCIWTHTHWHERRILTSSCSTLDQQKGSHMQSERGLWGQGAGFGKQPHCETCRSVKLKQAVNKLKGSLFLFLFIYIFQKKLWLYLCFCLLKRRTSLKSS